MKQILNWYSSESNVLKIPVNYSSDDLMNVNGDLIHNLIANFAEDTHKDQNLLFFSK